MRGRKKLNHEEVASRLDGTGVHWVGRYVRATEKVLFGCDECGHEWNAVPGSVFSGSGCPACFSREKRGAPGVLRPNERGTNEVLEDFGEWVSIDVSTPTMSDMVMLIDQIDYDFLRERGIGRIGVTPRGYAVCRLGNRSHLVHRLLLSGVKEVDHINQIKLDNRRANLRSVEAWQNQANRGKRKSNKSGVVGIDFHGGMWRAQKMFRGKMVLNKKFKTKEEAATAYAETVRVHCGEYAPKV